MPRQEPEELPDWVDSTHPDHSYMLVLFESNDAGAEEVDLTRAEYIALKAHLAAMRGYRVPTIQEALKQIAEANDLERYGSTPDDSQRASHLETARDFYKSVPHLVVMASEEFDRQLAGLAG